MLLYVHVCLCYYSDKYKSLAQENLDQLSRECTFHRQFYVQVSINDTLHDNFISSLSVFLINESAHRLFFLFPNCRKQAKYYRYCSTVVFFVQYENNSYY